MGGEPINYEGGREENDMKEWIFATSFKNGFYLEKMLSIKLE